MLFQVETADGCLLQCEEHGSKNKDVIIFLHGYTSYSGTWYMSIKVLQKKFGFIILLIFFFFFKLINFEKDIVVF